MSDRLNNEAKKNMKKGQGVNIAFLDIDEMSGATQAMYLLAILGSLAAALYAFYNMLVAAPEKEEQEKQRKLEEKKNRRAKKLQ